MSHSVRINDSSKEAVDALANEKGISPGEAAEVLIGMGVTRRNALARYADKVRSGEHQPKSLKKKPAEAAAKKPRKRHIAEHAAPAAKKAGKAPAATPTAPKRGRKARSTGQAQVEELSLN